MGKQTVIILGQVGSPKSTKVSDVRSYLREFLSDPRVIDVPRVIWFFILNLAILPTRPKKSAEAYKRIQFCGFFPLVEITRAMKRALTKVLPSQYIVEDGYLLSEQRFTSVLEKYQDQDVDIWALPQFPQFSDTTTSCFKDKIKKMNLEHRVKLIPNYHRLKAYIDLSARQIEKQIKKYPVDVIVLSFHGIPERYVVAKKDPYYQHCYETFILLRAAINFPKDKIRISFQSRLGSEKWLGPYTDQFCTELIEGGDKKIGVYCPSFVADCLETTDEIGTELKEEIEEHGGELTFIPCLNNQESWVKGYAEFITTYIEKGAQGSEEFCYQIDTNELNETMPDLVDKKNENTDEPLDAKAKKTIKVVFFTLFLDLIGFSIIFPMFPALAKYYLENDADNFFLKLVFGQIESFTNLGGSSMSTVVLFGGALGAIYSLLQFVAAPLWGGLSDRIGRKPILLISIFGLFISYVLWFFAGSFTILILARFIGGIMGGNLSVATAAVADVTNKSNRSKGMAFVGIAFAFGFIFGPAIGGALTLLNPLDYFPSYSTLGVNPFSFAAGFAAILSLINLFLVVKNFEETLKPDKTEKTYKTSNIFKLFKPLPIPDVNKTNFSYFLFISAFSGMEFTLTFLAVERLGYTSLDNAFMFVFIGILIALIQGGVVRRKAHQVGEKRMALMGLICIIPGLVIIGLSQSTLSLYLGLSFLAIGSALAIPTITSLVSLGTPDELQGQSLGIFRSLGSLGRVIGPIAASLAYWRFGSTTPYLACAVFLIVPVLVLKQVNSK